MPHEALKASRRLDASLLGGGPSLRQQWVDHCLRLSHTKADFYAGARKILRGVQLQFTSLDDSLQLSDAGYTNSKLTMLTRHYLHEESRRVALELWEKRRKQAKYGSIGFTCYAHFKKGDITGASPRGSVFGPCPQSVMITLIDKKTYAIDVPYRTTEQYKKYPADLVFLRDVLLKPFDFSGLKMKSLTCHFANTTCHSMYIVTILPHIKDPVAALESIRKKDDYFSQWCRKWTARYVCSEYSRGIQKFSQALRVRKDALERIDKDKLRKLQHYLRKNHPGHRNEYGEEDEE